MVEVFTVVKILTGTAVT